MLFTLLIGFAFGYIGSMPVAGPISVLVLHLGLEHNPRHALFVAVGGAVAEGGYALLAFWGLSTFMGGFARVFPAARVVGALLLLALGLILLLRRPRPAEPGPANGKPRGDKRSFALGFLITAVNPTLIITWTAVLAALNATGLLAMDRAKALPFAGSVSCGIIVWFLTLLWLAKKWRSRVSGELLGRFMKAMGAIMVAVGGWMAYRAL